MIACTLWTILSAPVEATLLERANFAGTKAYVVPDDVVLTEKAQRNGRVCALFRASNGRVTIGALPGNALEFGRAPREPTFTQWEGLLAATKTAMRIVNSETLFFDTATAKRKLGPTGNCKSVTRVFDGWAAFAVDGACDADTKALAGVYTKATEAIENRAPLDDATAEKISRGDLRLDGFVMEKGSYIGYTRSEDPRELRRVIIEKDCAKTIARIRKAGGTKRVIVKPIPVDVAFDAILVDSKEWWSADYCRQAELRKVARVEITRIVWPMIAIDVEVANSTEDGRAYMHAELSGVYDLRLKPSMHGEEDPTALPPMTEEERISLAELPLVRSLRY